MAREMGVATPASIVLLLVSLALLVGVASASVYQFYDGVTDPPPNYPLGGTGVVVFANSWAAQSLQASTDYTLARVDLWALENAGGSYPATLEVRADSAGSPNMAAPPLAAATTTAPSSFGWVSFNVAPNVLLTRGTNYWVVLENNGSSGSRGWVWWNTANDTFISDGHGGVSSGAGSSWSPALGDFAVRTFGYVETEMQLALTADRVGARAGEIVAYSIYFNNTGGVAAAQVWVNVTLPSGLTYFSDNASASNGVRTGDARWAFTEVEPGSHQFLLKASIDAGVANQSLLVTRVDLAYTDFRGVPMANSTVAVTLTVTGALPAGGSPNDSLGYLFFSAVLGWILLVGLWPRGKLEQVFLVNNGGTLVAHLCRSDNAGVDQDIFVGMLTAVQAFVRDSFAAAKEGDLKRMDFGPRKIYLRRGSHSYLAAVLNGRTPPTLRRKMRHTLSRIEEEYGEVLANWSGETEQVEGTVEMLSAGLLS